MKVYTNAEVRRSVFFVLFCFGCCVRWRATVFSFSCMAHLRFLYLFYLSCLSWSACLCLCFFPWRVGERWLARRAHLDGSPFLGVAVVRVFLLLSRDIFFWESLCVFGVAGWVGATVYGLWHGSLLVFFFFCFPLLWCVF